MSQEDAQAWVRLAHNPIPLSSKWRLLRSFLSATAIFQQNTQQLASLLDHEQLVILQDPTITQTAQDLAQKWCEQTGGFLVTLASDDFPQVLCEINEPPLLLYALGQRHLLQNLKRLAIVGSRHPTPQGLRDAEAFAQALAQTGITIVSGLAEGIDTAAHLGALKEAASTIAVLGSGCDRIFPKSNLALAKTISERGLLLSEFALNTPPLKQNFPRRNRIISGLCQGTMVVEAAVQSGSLITARLAAEQGREVFAMPGSIHSPQSRGCHQLIKQGSKLVETIQDIITELPQTTQNAISTTPSIQDLTPLPAKTSTKKNKHLQHSATPVAPSNSQRKNVVSVEQDDTDAVVLKAIGNEICTIDELVVLCNLTPNELQSSLLQLEFEGKIARLAGGRYQQLF